jgi:hypothetical protein
MYHELFAIKSSKTQLNNNGIELNNDHVKFNNNLIKLSNCYCTYHLNNAQLCNHGSSHYFTKCHKHENYENDGNLKIHDNQNKLW